MTCNLPESIISKIMLYNSPTADIIKTQYQNNVYNVITIYNMYFKSDIHNIKCYCGNIIRTYCSKCNQNIDDVECY